VVNARPGSEPWYRSRSPEQIVQSALAQSTRKNDAGCPTCIDAYIGLARKNGATEMQIDSALGGAESTNEIRKKR
jgi:hypothetical protein